MVSCIVAGLEIVLVSDEVWLFVHIWHFSLHHCSLGRSRLPCAPSRLRACAPALSKSDAVISRAPDGAATSTAVETNSAGGGDQQELTAQLISACKALDAKALTIALDGRIKAGETADKRTGDPLLVTALKAWTGRTDNILPVLELLLAAGCSPNATGGRGKSPLFVALFAYGGNCGPAALHIAVVRLLLAHGADLSEKIPLASNEKDLTRKVNPSLRARPADSCFELTGVADCGDWIADFFHGVRGVRGDAPDAVERRAGVAAGQRLRRDLAALPPGLCSCCFVLSGPCSSPSCVGLRVSRCRWWMCVLPSAPAALCSLWAERAPFAFHLLSSH